MASTSPADLARQILDECLRGGDWSAAALDSLVAVALDADPARAVEASRALFATLVEPLADRFESSLCPVYAHLFAHVIERARPDAGNAAALAARYEQVRAVRAPAFEPETVLIPSRVTLGADIAVTSLFLDAAKQRYPDARIVFAAPEKSWDLFEKDERLAHLPLRYPRSAPLRHRLAVFDTLREAAAGPRTLVLDPDSRLTQLGLLPICPPERHHLFESRAFGGDGTETLPALAAQWLRETIGPIDPQPYLHPRFHYPPPSLPLVTVSLGVGENPAKRIAGDFEEQLLAHLATLPAQVVVDLGAPGSEEEERVEAALGAAGEAAGRIGVHRGAFASFAAMIAASSLYIGYDSAGQHVAAALGIPLITVFNGYASPRTAARWRPDSPGPVTVIHAPEYQDAQDLWVAVRNAIRL